MSTPLLPLSPALVTFHVAGATIGLLSGFLSMLFRKGSNLHRAAGNVFVISMLSMTTSAAFMALFMKPNTGNVVAAMLTFYLVATGWWTARRKEATVGTFDRAAMLFAFAIAAIGWTFGFRPAAKSLAVMYFIFGTIAFLFGLSDIRMIARGGVAGAKRVKRHLLRMGLALLIATMSFYPGQAKLIPKESRSGLLYLPHMFLIGSIVFWMVRYSARKSVKSTTVVETSNVEARRAA